MPQEPPRHFLIRVEHVVSLLRRDVEQFEADARTPQELLSKLEIVLIKLLFLAGLNEWDTQICKGLVADYSADFEAIAGMIDQKQVHIQHTYKNPRVADKSQSLPDEDHVQQYPTGESMSLDYSYGIEEKEDLSLACEDVFDPLSNKVEMSVTPDIVIK